jgi:hypothetical protein
MVMATTWARPFVVWCAYTCGRRGGILIQRLGRDVVVSIMHQAAHKEKLISSPICLVLFLPQENCFVLLVLASKSDTNYPPS